MDYLVQPPPGTLPPSSLADPEPIRRAANRSRWGPNAKEYRIGDAARWMTSVADLVNGEEDDLLFIRDVVYDGKHTGPRRDILTRMVVWDLLSTGGMVDCEATDVSWKGLVAFDGTTPESPLPDHIPFLRLCHVGIAVQSLYRAWNPTYLAARESDVVRWTPPYLREMRERTLPSGSDIFVYRCLDGCRLWLDNYTFPVRFDAGPYEELDRKASVGGEWPPERPWDSLWGTGRGWILARWVYWGCPIRTAIEWYMGLLKRDAQGKWNIPSRSLMHCLCFEHGRVVQLPDDVGGAVFHPREGETAEAYERTKYTWESFPSATGRGWREDDDDEDD